LKRYNKKVLLSICLCICMLIQCILPGVHPLASENQIDGTLQITKVDKNGELLKNGDVLHQNDKIHFEYTFSVSDDFEKTIKIKIPKIFSFKGFSTKDIEQHIIEKDENDQIIDDRTVKCGKLSVDTNNNLVINFSDNVVSGIEITVELNAIVDLTNVSKQGNKVTYIINGTEYNLILAKEKPDKETEKIKEPTIVKSGSYENGIITWNLSVELNQTTGSSIIIKDSLENEQQLIEDDMKLPANCKYEFIDNELKFDLKDADRDNTLKFSYKTRLKPSFYGDNDEEKKVHNKAELFIDDKSVADYSKYLNIKSDWITKSAKVDKENKLIYWTIQVNNNYCLINNTKIIDKFPSKELSLNDDVALNGTKLDKNSYSIKRSSDDEPYTFTYDFKDSINTKQVLTFTTKVNNNDFTNEALSFNNTAELYFNDDNNLERKIKSNECTAVVGRSVIEQNSTACNPKQKQITWKVRVNHNKAFIKKGEINLDIAEGQELIDKSITINSETINWTPADNTGYIGKYTDKITKKQCEYKYSYNKNTRKLKFQFPNEINDEYLIGFNTVFTDDDKFKDYFADNNTNGENIIYNVKLLGEGINEQTCELFYTAKSDILSKSFEGYNYLTKEFSWKVNINKSKIKIDNPIFTDIIPNKLELVDGSFTVKKFGEEQQTINNDNCTNGNNIEYQLDTIDDECEISYKTKIKDSSLKDLFVETIIDSHKVEGNAINTVDVIGKNYAALESSSLKNGKIENIAADTEKNINRKSIIKEGFYNSECNCVDWEIIVNANNINLTELTNSTEAKIEDKLPSNIKLDLSSINLYELALDENGSLNEVSQVDISKDNIVYDEKSNKLDFILPTPLNKPYKLTFSTDIISGNSINNSAQLLMGNNFKQSDLKTDLKFLADGSGSGYGVLKSKKIIVNVKDADTGDNLKDSQIQLFNKFNDKINEVNTSEDGQVQFTKLKPKAEYSIKQGTLPKGYTECSKPMEGPEVNGNIIKYTIYNKKILRNIKFLVTDDNDNPIKGSIFEIYKDNSDIPLANAESNENGVVEFSDIPYGSYEIKQKYVPNGFNKNPNPITVIVDDPTVDNKTGVNIDSTKILNKAGVKNDFNITKNLIDGNGKKSPYAHDKLSLITLTGDLVATGETDDNGQLILEKIPAGDYYLVDNRAVAGVKHSPITKIHITDEENKIVEYNNTVEKFNNTEEITSDIVLIYVSNIKENIKNAKFKITSDDENYTDTQTSDENGVIIFKNLKPGEYTITSVEVPQGYKNNFLKKIIIGDDGISMTDVEIVTSEKDDPIVDSNINNNNNGDFVTKPQVNVSENTHNNKHHSIDNVTENTLESQNDGIDNDENKSNTSRDVLLNDTSSDNGDFGENSYCVFNNFDDSNTSIYDKNIEFNSSEASETFTNENKEKTNVNHKKLPQAGNTFDTKLLIVLGVIMITLGLIMRKKKQVQK